MDTSILLHKQLRENAWDLEREMLDLQNWQKEVKAKDEKLRNQLKKQPSLVPEIRQKKSSDKSNRKTQVNKKLKASQIQAMKIKNEGNALVKEEKWADAIDKYSQAISLYPDDPIFYANRALCYLKTGDPNSVISDCTKAVQLDGKQVKAYHRRAQAKMQLNQFLDAKMDVEKVLTIEPKNKEAKALLEKIKKSEEEIVLLPPWLPPLKNNVTAIKPATSVSVKLEKQFERIQVREISSKESIFEKTCKVLKPRLEKKQDTNVAKSKNCKILENSSPAPEIPTTSVSFAQHWLRYPSLDHRYSYLKMIAPDKIPKIFDNSMESDILSQILLVLLEKFVPSGDKTFEFLQSLSKVKRFGALVLFLTETDRNILRSLFDHCLNQEKRKGYEVDELLLVYNFK